MKLATWNINSLNVRLPQVLDWLAANPVDVLALQELKMTDDKFPRAAFQAAGYESVCFGQKTYNGVALISKSPAQDVVRNIPGFADDLARVISASYPWAVSAPGDSSLEGSLVSDSDKFSPCLSGEEFRGAGCFTPSPAGGMPLATQPPPLPSPSGGGSKAESGTSGAGNQVKGLRVICAYFPNGQEPGSEKFEYKLAWLDALRAWVRAELRQHPRLVLMGDYNITFDDADTWDPDGMRGQIHCTDEERYQLQALVALGLHDAHRLFAQAPKSYSWWDYRDMAFRRNHGMRIDHILISSALKPSARACQIDKTPRKNERPSDHAPVLIELA